ncbi:hypothetical protein WVIC16_60106 [Weissella viridescens]|nr:hypothetical protein WVIC16_60106 [Weissella viridescens]
MRGGMKIIKELGVFGVIVFFLIVLFSVRDISRPNFEERQARSELRSQIKYDKTHSSNESLYKMNVSKRKYLMGKSGLRGKESDDMWDALKVPIVNRSKFGNSKQDH